MSSAYFDQEALVTALCFHEEYGSQIVACVPKKSFTTAFNPLARKIYAFWERYNRPPKEIFINFIQELKEEYPDDAEAFDRLHVSILEHKDGPFDYTMATASKHVRQQRFNDAVMSVLPQLQRSDPDLDEAERVVSEALRKPNLAEKLDLGQNYTDWKLRHSDDIQKEEMFPCGIEAIDNMGLGPRRRQMWLTVATMKKGKTWGLGHSAKAALTRHKKVLHISLEMGEEEILRRYAQILHSLSSRPEAMRVPIIERDASGEFVGLTTRDGDQRYMDDLRVIRDTNRTIRNMKKRWKLEVEQFPTKQLDMPGLTAYLNRLQMRDGYVPDMLIIDYPDLMKFDDRDHRVSLGRLMQELRGIAVERNIALVVPSQGNRGAMKKSSVGIEDVGEDISKIAIADCIITYSQTAQEQDMQVARLNVTARSGRSGVEVLITQNYTYGQFCIDSCVIRRDKYFAYLRSVSDNGDSSPSTGRRRDRRSDASEDSRPRSSTTGTRGQANGRHPEFDAYSGDSSNTHEVS